MGYVIGCDIGSQAVKAILLSAEGQIVGEAVAEYEIQFPRPTWAEQDADDWIRGIIQAVAELIKITGVQGKLIRAIGLDAQVDGFVPINEAGKALYPAIIWMDRRAARQVEAIREKYVAYQLTGELGVDYSNASSTLLMDVRKKEWSTELCDCFQIPKERLAPIYPANMPIRHMRHEFAELTGLSTQTVVILGCGDEHAASLGAGVISPGLVCDIAGTAEPIGAASREPLFDMTGLVETHCHADPNLWLSENPGFVSGGNYRWLRDQFAADQVLKASQLKLDPYELINQEAETVPPASDGLVMLPCLSGAMTPRGTPWHGAFSQALHSLTGAVTSSGRCWRRLPMHCGILLTVCKPWG